MIPITFQPLTGPDYDNPRPVQFFAEGYAYKILGLIPSDTHLFGTGDGKPLHLLGTDKFGRDIFSRGAIGSRISLAIALIGVAFITLVGTLVGIAAGYLGGRFDRWSQAVVEIVLAFPQLPLYLTLTTLIPITAPTSVFLAFVVFGHRGARLGAAGARGARQDHVARPHRICARRASRRRIRQPHHCPAYFPECPEPHHRLRDARHPGHHPLGILPRLPRLRREAAADFLGPDAAGHRRRFR